MDDRRTEGAELDGSRRRFLAGSAAAVGGLALGTAPALADDHEDEEPFEDDVGVLNYALTLEYLEATFYERGLENIGEDALVSSELIEPLGEPIRDRVFDELTTVKEHERTHADTLATVVADLGGEPVPEPEFDFGAAVEDPSEFISLAAQLEDTGVAAYAGAAPFIENAEILTSALSIHSVEARHASYVRELGGMVGFPAAFDEPLPPAEVLEIAGQFIVESEDDH